MPSQKAGNGKHEDRKAGDKKKKPRNLDLAYRDDDDDRPTGQAKVTFEKDGTKVAADLPGWVVAVLSVVTGPWLTLSALPEGFPAWMIFALLLTQLAATVYVVRAVRRRGR